MSTNVYDMFIALELEALNMYFVFQKKGNSFNELNLIESIMYKHTFSKIVEWDTNNESAHKAPVRCRKPIY